MRIMPFSVLKQELLNRSKCQTIRVDKGTNYYNVGESYKAVYNARRPNRQLLGLLKITSIRKVLGANLNETDAILDGVNSLSELVALLEKLNNNQSIKATPLLIITFKWL